MSPKGVFWQLGTCGLIPNWSFKAVISFTAPWDTLVCNLGMKIRWDPGLQFFGGTFFFWKKKHRRKICSFFSKMKYRGNKTSKGKKTILEVPSWSCFYFSTAPPRKKANPVNSAWSFVHSRVLNLFIVKWIEDAQQKKTADSSSWFKWQKAKAIQLTIYINEIPDPPKVLEQLAKHRRKAPAVKDTVLNLQSCIF